MDSLHTLCNQDDKWKSSGFATGETSLRRITPKNPKVKEPMETTLSWKNLRD